MTSPYAVEAELRLLRSNDGGLAEPMPAPTPSLLLIFPANGLVEDEIQLGAMVSGPDMLVPGDHLRVRLSFWDDLGRIHATVGQSFHLRYDGRVIGAGCVTTAVPEDGVDD